MRGLDDTDRKILQLLLENSRRPYSEIAEEVGLSPPAVSDRVDRLREQRLVRRFTVDIDRSRLDEGTHMLVTVRGTPGSGEDIQKTLSDQSAVEFLYRTVDDTIVCTVTSAAGDVRSILAELPTDLLQGYDVRIIEDAEWMPHVGEAEFAPECVECGNRVSREGESERLAGTLYHFCCSSCRDAFVDQYQQLTEDA